MKRPVIPQWFLRAKEFHARVASPFGRPFTAKKEADVAKVYLYDEIGKDPWSDTGIDAKDILAALADAKGAKSLEVHINSPGGNVFDGVAIFNAIRAFDGPKTVHVDGIAASIASVIALAGDRVVTNEGAMWMIHEVASGIVSFGTADEIEEDARRTVTAMRAVQRNIVDIYCNCTGRPANEIEAWMMAEAWMTAEEAKARGFTDEIVKRESQVDPDDPDGDPDDDGTKPATGIGNLSPAALVAQARATRLQIQDRFPGASPGQPGQPGATNASKPGNRQKESTK